MENEVEIQQIGKLRQKEQRNYLCFSNHSNSMKKHQILIIQTVISIIFIVILIGCFFHFLFNVVAIPHILTNGYFLYNLWVQRWVMIIIIPFIFISIVVSCTFQIHFLRKTNCIKRKIKIKEIQHKDWLKGDAPIELPKASVYSTSIISGKLLITQFIVLISMIMFIVLLITLMVSYPISWGPIVMPVSTGAHVLWYTVFPSTSIISVENTSETSYKQFYFGTDNASDTQISTSQPSSVGKYTLHALFVNSSKFNFTLSNKQHSIDFSNPKKFIITTDINDQQDFVKNLTKLDYDVNLFAGDATNYGLDFEFQDFFMNLRDKPFIWSPGNHDLRHDYYKQIHQRPANSYVQVGDVGVFLLQVMTPYEQIMAGSPQNPATDAAIQFLESNIQNASASARHIFIITHMPVYSMGEPPAGAQDGVEYYQHSFNQFLNSHQNSSIRAVITGHDHVFSSYLVGNIYQFVSGILGGGKYALVTKNLQEHGAQSNYGGQYHLDSYGMGYWYMSFEVLGEKIEYRLVDAESGEEMKVYEQAV